MPERNTISQRIALEGAEDIKRQLAEIGQTGGKAFAQVKDAVESAQSNLAKVSAAVTEVQKQVSRVAGAGRSFSNAVGDLGGALGRFGGALTTSATRIGAVAAAAAAAGAGLIGLAKSAASVADEIGKQAQALGVTVQSYQRLQFAAAQAGVAQEQFAGGMARFSRAVIEAAKEQDKTARSTAENLKRIGIALSPAALAERALADAAAAAAKRQAELNVDVIRGGVSSKQQAESVEEAANALVRLGIGVKDASGKIRPLEEILGDLAERFTKLPDGPQKTAAAMELFGRAAGPRMIPLLNQGRAGMQEVMNQVQSMGLFVTREQAKIAEGMNDALSFMMQVARGARTQIGLVFAPVITRAADAFREAIARNWTTLQGFARDIEARIAPIVDDLIRLLEGKDSEVQNKSILAARDAILRFGRDAKSTINTIIVPAFRTLRAVLGGVADSINLVFGTQLTGSQVGLALAAARFLSLFSTISTAVRLAFAGVRVLIAGLVLLAQNFGLIVAVGRAALVVLAAFAGWPALIVAGVLAAAALIVAFWDEIKAGATAAVEVVTGAFQVAWQFIDQGFAALSATVSSAWEAITSATAALWEEVKGLFTSGVQAIAAFFANLPTAVSGAIAAALALVSGLLASLSQMVTAAFNALSQNLSALADTIRSAWNGLFDWFGGKIESLLQWFTALIARVREFLGLSGQAASEGGNAGFARGGPVRGAGTATSDSIPAWLSHGEFVIRAAAVQKYGAALFDALNRMRLPRDGFHFAFGGLVEALAPPMLPLHLPLAMADGGLVRPSLRPINLSILGQQFDGLLAPEEVADKLVKFALRRQVASGGRKPSWYGKA
jgi:hypothetical protein